MRQVAYKNYERSMIPYGRQSVDEGDIAAVVKVLRSDWLTTGPAVTSFEDAICAAARAGHAVVVSSGTAALHTAYAAAGIGPGDEVITPPLTFIATQSMAAVRGATVRFADVQPDTGNIDPAAVEPLINERTKAIVAVDYAGHPADLDELAAIARRHGILLIEDAAHSIGSLYRGRPVGSIADLTALSFFATKNITTAEGGAVVTADPVLAERARAFRNHGLVRDPARQRMSGEGAWHQEVHEFGLNYRMPDVLAALGHSQLARIGQFKQRRAEIVEAYDRAFGDLPGVTTPAKRPCVDPMWHLYPLRVPVVRRREIFDALRAAGIGVQVNYIPAYWHPVFADLGLPQGLCPNAEAYYRREISLPLWPGLSDDEVELVVEAVREAVTAPTR